MISWTTLMSLLRGGDREPLVTETPIDVTNSEAQSALSALDHVGCVEVSEDVAERLGAFDEKALTLDDVNDAEEG